MKFSAFTDLSALSGGAVLLVLEHDKVLSEETLERLCPWTEEDRVRMSEFRHRGALTSWCLSRLLFRRSVGALSGDGLRGPRLSYGPYGKPFLPRSRLRFNWAHASGCVVLAVAADREVGCDVEDVFRVDFDPEDLARSQFSGKEAAWISGGEDEARRRTRFLSLFTQKEARLKASGVGLGAPLATAEAELAEPPHVGADCRVFLSGTDGRYIVATCFPGGLPEPLEIRFHRFEAGAVAGNFSQRSVG